MESLLLLLLATAASWASEGAPRTGFRSALTCPKGFEPSPAAPGRPLRCVPAAEAPRPAAGGAAPPACPPGMSRVRTENPFEPLECRPAAAATPALPATYLRHEVPGHLRFEYPAGWHVTDAWKDEVPSIYVQHDAGRDGKPVMLSISRYRRRSRAYQDMATMMRQERDWHGAKDGGRGAVAGLPARFLEVPGESRMAFLQTADGHFVLGFSAPEDLYRAYAPAYARLLKSFRVVHDDRDPVPEEERAQ